MVKNRQATLVMVSRHHERIDYDVLLKVANDDIVKGGQKNLNSCIYTYIKILSEKKIEGKIRYLIKVRIFNLKVLICFLSLNKT